MVTFANRPAAEPGICTSFPAQALGMILRFGITHGTWMHFVANPAIVAALGVCCFAATTSGHAAEIDMAKVRQLAKQPVHEILRGTSFTEISDADYRQKIDNGSRPAIVVFYADQDEKSRLLATLARYLAADFSSKIGFYAYRTTNGARAGKKTLQHVLKSYGVKQIPATLFYDNDKGRMELERTNYTVPTLAEYRAPNTLFFKMYYSTIRDYIEKNILD
jgi:hypothetical protein